MGSNDRVVSAVDWRDNRLADALAKDAAAGSPECQTIQELLKPAEILVRHETELLGATTAAANSCEVSFVVANGDYKRTIRGDSTGARDPPQASAPYIPASLSTCSCFLN